jgi:ubiquitin-conjugating enzyme E2 D/E
MRVQGKVQGPEGTPYEGGVFHVSVVTGGVGGALPQVTFLTRVWHPNIDPCTGSVCCQDFPRAASAMELCELYVPLLLQEPCAEDPSNEVAGAQALGCPAQYTAFVKGYTAQYAKGVSTAAYSSDPAVKISGGT